MVIRSWSCARTFAQGARMRRCCRDFLRLLFFNCQVFFHLFLIYIAMTKIEKSIVTSFIAILWCFDILVFRIFGLAAAITTFFMTPIFFLKKASLVWLRDGPWRKRNLLPALNQKIPLKAGAINSFAFSRIYHRAYEKEIGPLQWLEIRTKRGIPWVGLCVKDDNAVCDAIDQVSSMQYLFASAVCLCDSSGSFVSLTPLQYKWVETPTSSSCVLPVFATPQPFPIVVFLTLQMHRPSQPRCRHLCEDTLQRSLPLTMMLKWRCGMTTWFPDQTVVRLSAPCPRSTCPCARAGLTLRHPPCLRRRYLAAC
jgi:hypothetical protein